LIYNCIVPTLAHLLIFFLLLIRMGRLKNGRQYINAAAKKKAKRARTLVQAGLARASQMVIPPTRRLEAVTSTVRQGSIRPASVRLRWATAILKALSKNKWQEGSSSCHSSITLLRWRYFACNDPM
jgi:hypothetical protein